MESENHLFWRDNHFPNLQFCSSMLVSGGVEERPVCVDIAASGSRFFLKLHMCFDAEKEFAQHVMSMIYMAYSCAGTCFLTRKLTNCTFHSFFFPSNFGEVLQVPAISRRLTMPCWHPARCYWRHESIELGKGWYMLEVWWIQFPPSQGIFVDATLGSLNPCFSEERCPHGVWIKPTWVFLVPDIIMFESLLWQVVRRWLLNLFVPLFWYPDETQRLQLGRKRSRRTTTPTPTPTMITPNDDDKMMFDSCSLGTISTVQILNDRSDINTFPLQRCSYKEDLWWSWWCQGNPCT